MASRAVSQRGVTKTGKRSESSRGVTRKPQGHGLEAAPVIDATAPAVGHVLRRAREYHQLSLRDVERRIGRSNAYLSQVERGLIRRPDPVVLLELADLYRLNFVTLASWVGWLKGAEGSDVDDGQSDSLESRVIRAVLQLDNAQRAHLLGYLHDLIRQSET